MRVAKMIESMDVARAAVEAAMSAGADYADARVNRLLSVLFGVHPGDVYTLGSPVQEAQDQGRIVRQAQMAVMP